MTATPAEPLAPEDTTDMNGRARFVTDNGVIVTFNPSLEDLGYAPPTPPPAADPGLMI